MSAPRSTSITCFTPKRCPVRHTADSAFCASTVPSNTSGGSRHTSQLPHPLGRHLVLVAEVAEQRAAPARHRLGERDHRVELVQLDAHALRVLSRRRPSMSCRAVTTSCSPYSSSASAGAPSRPARPVSW